MNPSEYGRIWRARKQKKGLCIVCGVKKPHKTLVTCDICLKKAKERRQEWLEKGRCIFCGKAVSGFRSCTRCSYLKRVRQLPLEDREQAFLDLQNKKARCMICKAKQAGGPHNLWHLDHDHKTKRYRGLLCFHCNIGLGVFKDSVSILLSAIEYLKSQKV